jgi:serine/threonine kinase PknH
VTTPPPPWEAHPPLPEDEFREVDRVSYGDPDEDTGPIRVAPQESTTTVIRTDRSLQEAAEPTVFADTGSAETAIADTTFLQNVADPPDSLNRQETAFAPIHVDGRTQYAPAPVPRPEDTYAGRFTAPLSVDPRAVPVKHKNIQPVIIAVAAVAAVLLAALAAWWLWPSGGDDQVVADSSSPSTPTVDAEGHDKLMSLLPSGYPAGACTAEAAPDGAVAVVNCTRNADAGGPASATYTLAKDAAALDAAIEKTISEARVVNCPGRIQSPGPWRRNASPNTIAGTLVCGMADKQGTVAWTTDSALLLNVTRADPEGPTLDQLFTWWQTHS